MSSIASQPASPRMNMPAEPDTEPAYFEFKGSGDKDFFVIKLVSQQTIAHARAILSGAETSAVHPQGTIVQAKASYNPNWSFHYAPASISFFQLAVEVCDANMKYIEEHLDEVGGAFLPQSHWCPWNSALTREIPASDVTDE